MAQHVLLCDDEIHILRAAEFKLKRAGYDVRIAGDGQEAWEAIEVQKPDILITDCQMPRLDGFGLVQRVRQNPDTEHLPCQAVQSPRAVAVGGRDPRAAGCHRVVRRPEGIGRRQR